ncbi:hydroxymethylbilane synthase [Pseudoleptotrichia goodfellowii]|jgi:hydroxymethylbilane synthase|uniref:Porphobilinogen deaminase n=1 Tax=Pseudoleptotrichia goodfellowii F0264 TaxID=596323 RepID=D0GL80_9FUSO|nr:hydroxymethylbilane synthase [Pseudoleptotrichia goodfellowii]EEY35188.1 hydroxymethylbilane synthase [Pseudoleptotrichia goodfellowii F0264]MBF4805398.1 hydroxymethylbilane synthase [Pseudoleptotrichia goodfellowii]
MKSNKIIIGTRGSILALAQAEKVKEMLIAKYDELRKKEDFKGISDFNKNESLTIELKIIVTTGDKDLRDFDKIKGTTQKELFVKEIEKEMLENKIDFAVHSLKDMPQQTPEGLLNACFPLREDNRDVIVSKSGKKLNELREKSVIGTGSIRRETELLNLRKDIIIKPIRGNIHTRLKKLDNGEYDAIILAAAGLKRTGLSDRITEYFEDEVFMPAPGQGILCIQCRENDDRIRELLEIINDKEVGIMCETEREFSRIFDGGCHTPIGCSSTIEGNTLKLKGVYNKDGKRIFSEIEGDKNNPKEIAQKLAKEIKNNE